MGGTRMCRNPKGGWWGREVWDNLLFKTVVPNLFGNRDEFQFVKDNFSTDCDVVGGKQFGDGSSALHLLCTLYLLLLHQLYLRSSGIRSQRSGIPGLKAVNLLLFHSALLVQSGTPGWCFHDLSGWNPCLSCSLNPPRLCPSTWHRAQHRVGYSSGILSFSACTTARASSPTCGPPPGSRFWDPGLSKSNLRREGNKGQK